MELRPLRWALLVGLACLGLAVALLPFPRRTTIASTPAEARVMREVTRLQAANGRRAAALRGYFAMDALTRWRAAAARHPASAVVVDASVPVSMRPIVDSVARASWRGLGSTASAERAAIFVYVDTARFVGGIAIGNPTPTAETFYALPQATGGRCVTLIRLSAASEALVGHIAPGICGFYAAFGAPGRRVGAWLGGTRYAMARRAAWAAPDETVDGAYGLAYALSADGASCLDHVSVDCLRALGIRTVPAVTTITMSVDDEANMPAGMIADAGVNDWELAGVSLDRMFSDVVREVGASRFAAFWRSDAAPDVAFAKATGGSLRSWTHEWLATHLRMRAGRPALRARSLVWLALALPLLLVAAVRRRERLLAVG